MGDVNARMQWAKLSVEANIDNAAKDLAWAALACVEGSDTRDRIGEDRADEVIRSVLNDVEERIQYVRERMDAS